MGGASCDSLAVAAAIVVTKFDSEALLGSIFCEFLVKLTARLSTEDNWCVLVILAEVGQPQKRARKKNET